MRRVVLALILLAGLLVGGSLTGSTEPTGSESASEHASSGEHSGHQSPVAPVLLGAVVILLAAKLGGELAERVHQPAVLGELVAGVVIGNLGLIGFHALGFLATNEGIAILAELGVILLLFEVGLESNVREMMSVGASSLLVASLGIVAPFFIGWGVSAWFLPDEEMLVHIFIGATLCATSVGITARVLTDLGKVATREAKIILGAAVIDDVLGLVILAVVSGVISAANTGGELASSDILLIIAKATVFLVGALVFGSWLSPRLFRLASKLKIRGMLLTLSLSFCFFLAYLANAIELAPIVGAFAAGLILDDVHFHDFLDRGDHALEELIHPINIFLVPIFFVLMGIRVDLATFGQVEVLGFAAVLSIAAIIGKMICALGVVERGLDRISVAVGMVPRGEVGLIFAGIGAALVLHGRPVVSAPIFSAVVIMVIVTTLITPPVLKSTLARGEQVEQRKTGKTV
jgi:Kef-type K+ transport system membrane component KefB